MKRFFLLIWFIVIVSLVFTACNSSEAPAPKSIDGDSSIYAQGSYYKEYDLSDSTGRKYSYYIYDKQGAVLFHDEGETLIMPEILQIGNDIIQIAHSAGTGVINYRFFNAETRQASEWYDYRLHRRGS